MNRNKSQSPTRHLEDGPLVRPPVTDRSAFAGLPVVNTALETEPALDPKASGAWSSPALNEIERGAVRRFAEAVGETNPVHFDERAARAQGYRHIVAPMGFAFALRSAQTLQPSATPNRTVLNSEQQLELLEPICVGDRIAVSSRITEINQRPGTTVPMEFVVLEEEGRDPTGKLVFRTRRTLLVRAGREQFSNVQNPGA